MILGAVDAERIKLQSVRSPLWLALTVAVLSLGFAAVQAAAALPYSTLGPERAALGVAMFGVPVLMILAALSVTGEYRTGMIRTTFMATPHRWQVLVAKAIVGMTLSGFLAALMSLGSMILIRAMVDGRQGEQLALTEFGVWRTTGAVALYAASAALLAVGLGALLRHSAAVIAILLLLPFVVEPLLGATPGVGSKLGPLLPFANANAFTGIPWLQSFSMFWGPVGSAVYFAGVSAAMFVAAVVVVGRRDP